MLTHRHQTYPTLPQLLDTDWDASAAPVTSLIPHSSHQPPADDWPETWELPLQDELSIRRASHTRRARRRPSRWQKGF